MKNYFQLNLTEIIISIYFRQTDGFDIVVKIYNNQGINMQKILTNNWKKYRVKKYNDKQ